MTAAQTFPQGLADGTTITTGNTSTGGQSSMTIGMGTGASLQADTGIGAFASQGGVGETWLFINGTTGTFAQYAVSETTNCADKATHQWAGAAMPGVIDRIIDQRNSGGTACRISVSATNFPYVEDTTGIIATGTTALTTGVEYRFELAITVAAGSATVTWGVYVGNSATPIAGNSGTVGSANTGSTTITLIRHISSAAASGGAWQKNVGAFQHASQSTLIGPVSGAAVPVNFVMEACQPVFSTGRGNQLGIANFGAAVVFATGRNMALSIGATGAVNLVMPPSSPVVALGRNPGLGGVTPLAPPPQPIASRNSLIYGGLELLGGAGALYNILTGDRNLGNAQVVNTTVESPFLDGALVTGTMLGNRTIALHVLITATSRIALSVATEALLKICYSTAPVDLVWSPIGGLPIVFDTWRGVGDISWQSATENVFARQVSLQFDALPAGRSPVRLAIGGSSGAVTVMDFTNPAAFTYHTPDAADATVYTRIFTNPIASPTVPEPTLGINHGPITTSPYPVDGAASTQVDTQPYCTSAPYSYTVITGGAAGGVFGGGGGGQPSTVYVPAHGNTLARVDSGTVSLNLAATTNLRMATFAGTNVELVLTLRDSHGAAVTVPFTEIDGSLTDWSHFILDLSTITGIDLTSITSLALYVATGDIYTYTTGMPTVPVVLSPLRAYPATSSLTTTTNGTVLRFAGLQGTVPAPVAFAINRGGTATMSGILLYRAPADTAPTTPVLLGLVGGGGTTPAPSTLHGTYRIVIGAPSSQYGLTIQQNLNGVPIPGAIWTSGPGAPMGPNYSDLGEVTLPLVATPGTVSGTTYTISYGAGISADLIFLDTQGRLMWVPQFTPAPYLWADEATASGLGGVWAGPSVDETDARSVLGGAVAPQINGAFTLSPGDNYVLIHCPDGLPSSIVASYAPRFLAERST